MVGVDGLSEYNFFTSLRSKMERLRVLHTADIHLGAKFTGLGARGREQRRKLLETFDKIVDLAINSRVHLVLVAGDLFDSNRPAPELVSAVLRGFDRLANQATEICLVPGTHDRYGETSVYRREEFTQRPYLHVLTDIRLTPIALPSLSTTVWGRALVESQPEDVLAGLRRQGSAHWQLALVHGSLRLPGRVEQDEALIDPASLAACGMDYVALGHWHSLADYSRWGPPTWYCGAPEPISARDRDAGYVILAEFPREGVPEIKPVRVSRRRAETLYVNMDEIADALELRRRLEDLADENLMLEVVLRGLASPHLLIDPLELQEDLAPFFFHLRIEDGSSLSVEDVGKLRLPPNTLGGRFLQLAQARIAAAPPQEKHLVEEALRVGLAYLERSDTG